LHQPQTEPVGSDMHPIVLYIVISWLLSQLLMPISVLNSYNVDAPLQSLADHSRLSDKALLDTLAQRARNNVAQKSVVAAKQDISEAFDLAKRKNLEIPYTLYWANAELMASQKDYSSAYKDMDKVSQILKKTGLYQETALAQIFLARMLYYTGNFNKALENCNNVIRLAEDKGLKGIIPDCYRCMADVYNMLGKREKERECVKQLIESSLREDNQDFLARGYFRMGQIKIEVDSDYKASNIFYKKSLQIRKQRGDSSHFPLILNRISWNYYLLKEFDSALGYYDTTLNVSLRQKNFPTVANVYGNMGTIHRDKKDYNKALYYYGKSTAYAMINKDWYTLSWVGKDMSDMYHDMGDYEKAYECYIQYKNYNDSLSQQKYLVGLADARMRYEADTKAKELELVNLKVNQQRYYIFGLSAFILLVVMIGILLFRQSKINSRRQISEMKRKIAEITQANLRQQMNPHFIFNTLNSIQYYMYRHDKIAVNNYLTKFSTLMRKTLENSQLTAIPIKEELDALGLYLELESLRFKEKFEYSIDVDEEIDPLLYKIPTMLLQPYVENSICHGLINKEGKGTLNISIRLNHDYLFFIIEDNGIGREAAMKIKMSKEKNHPSLGTKITESRMEVANAFYGTRMKVHYTDLVDDKANPAGTRVEIQIPLLI
jgi:tetratricopeptide (TPR) repeat protein